MVVEQQRLALAAVLRGADAFDDDVQLRHIAANGPQPRRLSYGHSGLPGSVLP
jgi:hypothetical protein